MVNIEIRRLLQLLVVLADGHEGQTQIEAECFIASLQAFQCKLGCLNCSGNELYHRLLRLYEESHHDYGKCAIRFFQLQE